MGDDPYQEQQRHLDKFRAQLQLLVEKKDDDPPMVPSQNTLYDRTARSPSARKTSKKTAFRKEEMSAETDRTDEDLRTRDDIRRAIFPIFRHENHHRDRSSQAERVARVRAKRRFQGVTSEVVNARVMDGLRGCQERHFPCCCHRHRLDGRKIFHDNEESTLIQCEAGGGVMRPRKKACPGRMSKVLEDAHQMRVV